MTAMLGALLDGTTAPGVYLWRGRDDRDIRGLAIEAGWHVLGLDTRDATTVEGFYDALAHDWYLAEWFGRNLDALWDVLAELSERRTLVVWDGADALASHEPDFAAALLGVFRDATNQADALAVLLRRTEGVPTDPTLLSGLDGLL